MIIKLVVAEYSVSQGCFHVHDVASMLTDNIQNMIRNGDSDYLVIGIFNTDLEAHQYIERVREQMDKQGDDWVNQIIKRATE